MTTKIVCTICTTPIDIPESKTIADYQKFKITFSGDHALHSSNDPVATKCNHAFHQSCLKAWIDTFIHKTSSATCPMCRTNLLPPSRNQNGDYDLNNRDINELNIEEVNESLALFSPAQLGQLSVEQLGHPALNLMQLVNQKDWFGWHKGI